MWLRRSSPDSLPLFPATSNVLRWPQKRQSVADRPNAVEKPAIVSYRSPNQYYSEKIRRRVLLPSRENSNNNIKVDVVADQWTIGLIRLTVQSDREIWCISLFIITTLSSLFRPSQMNDGLTQLKATSVRSWRGVGKDIYLDDRRWENDNWKPPKVE